MSSLKMDKRGISLIITCVIFLLWCLHRRWLHQEETRRGILSVEQVKDTSLGVLKETFKTESDKMIVNCNYKKINSVPGDIVLTNKLKGSYLDEITNEVLEGLFKRNLKYDKTRHKELLDNKIYYYENKDKYFKEKVGFYLAQKFEAFLASIDALRGFQVKEIYIGKLIQPDVRTSRSFYVDFDVLIHREEKNHGKHLKCLAEIVDIRSFSRLNFRMILYSIKVIGIVMEDMVSFEVLPDPFYTSTYKFVRDNPFQSSGFSPS